MHLTKLERLFYNFVYAAIDLAILAMAFRLARDGFIAQSYFMAFIAFFHLPAH